MSAWWTCLPSPWWLPQTMSQRLRRAVLHSLQLLFRPRQAPETVLNSLVASRRTWTRRRSLPLGQRWRPSTTGRLRRSSTPSRMDDHRRSLAPLCRKRAGTRTSSWTTWRLQHSRTPRMVTTTGCIAALSSLISTYTPTCHTSSAHHDLSRPASLTPNVSSMSLLSTTTTNSPNHIGSSSKHAASTRYPCWRLFAVPHRI